MSAKRPSYKAPKTRNELTEEMWLAREVIGPLVVSPSGKESRTVTVELVWGKRVSIEGGTLIEGEAHHVLNGPTALASIQQLASRLNGERYKPKKSVKCVADGGRLPKDGGPAQMVLGELPHHNPNPQ